MSEKSRNTVFIITWIVYGILILLSIKTGNPRFFAFGWSAFLINYIIKGFDAKKEKKMFTFFCYTIVSIFLIGISIFFMANLI